MKELIDIIINGKWYEAFGVCLLIACLIRWIYDIVRDK